MSISRRRRSRLTPRGRVVVLSGGALIVLVAFLWAGLNAPNSIPGRSYYTVTVQFADAGNITPHTQVRRAGKLVGQVLNPRYENGHATAELQLDEDLRPLSLDASVRVRPRSAVGSPYVELDRGRSPQGLPEGEILPADRSTAAVPIDEVLSAFDEQTRASTGRFLRELGETTAGRGEDVNGLLDRTPPLARDVRVALEPLRRDPSAIQTFVPAGARMFGALEPVRMDIATGWDVGGRSLDALNQPRELRAALDVAPGSLATLRNGLRRTDPMLAALDRFARRGLPVLRAAPDALRATDGMLRSANATVGDLRLTLERARLAVDPALALLRTTTTVLPRLDVAMAAARPIIDELAPRRCDMLSLTDNWSSMLSNGNASGNFLRLAVVTAGFNSITGIQDPDIVAPGTVKNPYPAPCQAAKDKKR